jgi:hypothetical protein
MNATKFSRSISRVSVELKTKVSEAFLASMNRVEMSVIDLDDAGKSVPEMFVFNSSATPLIEGDDIRDFCKQFKCC